VVIDEIQYCANVRSVRTRACIKLADGVSSVLGLSGTPFTNKLIELWPVLHIVKPELFPDRIQYAWDYCKPRYVHPWGWRFDGAVNKGRLKDILEEHCMIRRLKRDVAKELPAKQESIIWTRLKDYSDYHAAESDFLSWLRKISPARAIRARRSAALTRVGYLLRLVARLKLPRVVQWIKEFYELHPDKKLVAFTMNRFVIDALKEQFPHALVIDGRVKGRMREEVKNRFQTHKKSKLLIGHWKAAGVGLTLTAAHNVLACDLPWVPPVVWQGIDRVHRIGQKDKVVAHYIVTLGTIEEKQLKAHNQKAKIFHAVFDRKKPKNFKDFNVLDELLHSYYSLIAR
jgi:SWI/SNF-related matrix-associated actin-dependent regulator 1 of chromatin subfamily A